MFLSLFLILTGGLAAGWLVQKAKLPPLLGMLGLGILLSPHALNLIDPSLQAVSADIRQAALIVILIRAGLDLKLEDLKQAGIPAALMCFVPASFEILGCVLLGPVVLGLSFAESLLAGSVLAAVSPAVVVPGMLRLMEKKRGTAQKIPQLILAGASADDIFCLVLFACFLSLNAGSGFNAWMLLQIPTSIVFGTAGGVLAGLLLSFVFRRAKIQKSSLSIIVFGTSCLLVYLEKCLSGPVGFSGLLAVICMSMTVSRKCGSQAKELSGVMNGVWKCAQIFLFVLVGAAVDLSSLANAGLGMALLIVLVMCFRMAGVFAALLPSRLAAREKLFCMLAYTPKATVQAAIGAVPLSMGLACGPEILSLAVLAILITAPFGAAAIDITSSRLLKQEQ